MSENIDNERGKTFTAQKPMTDPTADAAKLLPCPFCSSLAVLDDLGGDDSFFVRCTKCEVQQIANYSETEAVSRWNTRPQPAPLDVVLHCPYCKAQHIDKPEGDWTNPPHRSHLCHNCGAIWRAADQPTNGVEVATTEGGADRLPAHPAPPAGEPEHLREPLIELLAKIEDGPYIGAAGVADAVLELIGRRGLAARPKVEDAEVATEIALIDGFLGGTHSTDKASFRLYMKRWRDLLEHLAAKLAEADAVIAFYHDFDHYEGGRSATADEEKWDNEAMERHAARQQQKL